jgi:hypothetical protein
MNSVPSQGFATGIHVEELPLSPALDLAASFDPTHIARQLLALIPGAPPLTTVLRLILCIKPHKEDWDAPEFPIYERLEGGLPDTVEDLLEVLAKPIEAPLDNYRSLSRAISELMPEKVGSTVAW